MGTIELLRSLALNRHAALSYTRDKLLFYAQQERAARRHRLSRQGFGFELGYHLSHYYVLLWSGLDQICWIVNATFDCGFTARDWRQVGIRKQAFLARLEQKVPDVHRIYSDPEFKRWVSMLAGARHFVAHGGFAMPGEAYIRPEEEPTDEELDRDIEASDEWQKMAWLPRGIRELSRPTLRLKARLRRSRRLEERVLHITVDGEECVILPLVNVEWDFDHFFTFAHQIAALGVVRLSKRGAE